LLVLAIICGIGAFYQRGDDSNAGLLISLYDEFGRVSEVHEMNIILSITK